MKLQSLAIIFILIVLPLTIILTEYSNAQLQTMELQKLYDSRLITATYDALKAFQINTFNDTESDIAGSKLESIEASTNAFFNSMESGFRLQGYAKEDLQKYVPALVYTMYDGYYIYSPYENVATTNDDTGVSIDAFSSNNEIEYGFKPYIYYSCRYKPNSTSDFIITYALDNHISIQGIINGEYINKSGYLLTNVTFSESNNTYYYDGIEIKPENSLTENLVQKDSDGNISSMTYKYIKLNGVKYYLNEGAEESNQYIFRILNGTRLIQVSKKGDPQNYEKFKNLIENNTSAINYYKEAYEFTKWLTSNSTLNQLKSSDAIDSEGNSINLSEGTYNYIFQSDVGQTDIPFEYPNSNFNSERKAVIRYSIESSLSVSIANFNNYSGSTNNFQMPKLKETEWELLENQVSIISFLQGLSIGGKIYNGYTVVTNDKTKEVVKEESIYIASNGYYHKVNDNDLKENGTVSLNSALGILSLDFQIRKDMATEVYYTPRSELGCYTSIVNSNNVDNNSESIYEYLKNTGEVSDQLKQLYYTALGRERYGTFKTENQDKVTDIIGDMISGTSSGNSDQNTDDSAPNVEIIGNTSFTLSSATTQVDIGPKVKFYDSESGIEYAKYIFIPEGETPPDNLNEWNDLSINGDGKEATTVQLSKTVTTTGNWTLYVQVKNKASQGQTVKYATRTFTIKNEIVPIIRIYKEDGSLEVSTEDQNINTQQYTIPSNSTMITFKRRIVIQPQDGISVVQYNFSPINSQTSQQINFNNGDTIIFSASSPGTYILTIKVQYFSGEARTLTVPYNITKDTSSEMPTVQIVDTDGKTSYKTSSTAYQPITIRKQIKASSNIGISSLQYAVTDESNINNVTNWINAIDGGNFGKNEIVKDISSVQYISGTTHIYIHVRATDKNGNIKTTTKSYLCGNFQDY